MAEVPKVDKDPKMVLLDLVKKWTEAYTKSLKWNMWWFNKTRLPEHINQAGIRPVSKGTVAAKSLFLHDILKTRRGVYESEVDLLSHIIESRLPKPAVQAMLRELKLRLSGNKPVLVKRLVDHCQQQSNTIPSVPNVNSNQPAAAATDQQARSSRQQTNPFPPHLYFMEELQQIVDGHENKENANNTASLKRKRDNVADCEQVMSLQKKVRK